jgi:hypothetical protein
MAMIAITTITSIRVKPRAAGGGELLVMEILVRAHDIAPEREAKAKKIRNCEIA